MSVSEKSLGKMVFARDYQGQPKAVGVMIGYQSRPTCDIERPDGSRINWCADVVEEIAIEDQDAAEMLVSDLLKRNDR